MSSTERPCRMSVRFILGLIATLGFTTAWADDTTALQEVVVTAQKRSQDLQKVGISMSALSGEQLQTLGINSSVDLAKTLSNVAVSGSYAGQMSQFTIRGVTQNDFNDHVESVVALYIDDTYVAMQQGQTFASFDLDHVEALKGPQGTLFGRNATAGLVHYITNRPAGEFGGYVNADYGSYNTARVETALNIPLTDKVWTRVSGLFERYDGYIHNVYPSETFVPPAFQAGLDSSHLPGAGADLGGLKYQGALRAQLLAHLSDSSKLLLSAFWSQSVSSTGPYLNLPSITVYDAAGNQINNLLSPLDNTCQAIQVGLNGQSCTHGAFSSTPGVLRPVAGADFFGYRNPTTNGRTTSCDYCFGDANSMRTMGATANFSTELAGATFTSITDYKNFYKFFSLDLEAAPENQFFWHGESDENTLSQELRLNGTSGRSDWVAGGYFLYINNHSVHGIGALSDSAYPVNNWTQPRIVTMKTRSYSLFGQEEYALTDSLSLVAGLRGTIEKKGYNFQVLFVDPATGCSSFYWCYSPAIDFPGFSQGLYSSDSSETLWNWKLQADWHITQNAMLYAGVTQGMKAGSFNAGGPPLPASEIPYKPERLVSYESGLKSTFWNGRARLNASAFYYDYHDYQAARWLGFSSLITNQNANFYGAEIDFNTKLTSDLELTLNLGMQHNKVKGLMVAGEPRDVHAAYAPEQTAAAILRYTLPKSVFSYGQLAFQLDGNYQSSVYDNPDNFIGDRLPGYTLTNARVSWLDNSGNLKVEAYVSNLTNKVYRSVGFDLSQICGCNLAAYGKPRWAMLDVSYHF